MNLAEIINQLRAEQKRVEMVIASVEKLLLLPPTPEALPSGHESSAPARAALPKTAVRAHATRTRRPYQRAAEREIPVVAPANKKLRPKKSWLPKQPAPPAAGPRPPS